MQVDQRLRKARLRLRRLEVGEGEEEEEVQSHRPLVVAEEAVAGEEERRPSVVVAVVAEEAVEQMKSNRWPLPPAAPERVGEVRKVLAEQEVWMQRSAPVVSSGVREAPRAFRLV